MATNTKYTVNYRRKREGKTNYRQRLSMLKNDSPRFVVRKTLKHIIIQIIRYSPQGDKIIASSHTAELKKQGWKGATSNTSAAYLCGALTAKKTKKQNVTQALSDLGQCTSIKGAIVYAAIKGANDHGLTVPCSPTVYPSQERINGTHIAGWAQQLKQADQTAYKRQFGTYLQQGLEPETLPKHFEQTLKKIKGDA